jgi:iron complex outermembrane receptor protein
MKKHKIAKAFFASALVYTVNLNAQSSLSGFVKSSSGEPIPFAVIGIKNSQLSSVSNADGAFNFKNLKEATYIFTTKCLGYADHIDTVFVNGALRLNLLLQESNKQLDEVVVSATRVDNNSGMAFNNIDSETLKKQNLGQDAPYMLSQLPSVVVNSDAGNGVGYTGLRIRGSDATRINVTINGVPVNDAESQGTYFVDMPDLVSSTNNIQVQRGVGASSNGAGAFGASINFQTNELKEKAYANVISTAGSYNTFRNTLSAGTGLLNNKFTLDARASNITSNGYIDRASSNLQSYYLAAGYYGKKSVLKFINFLGQEKTYQAWNYVLEDSVKKGNRTYNSCGEYYDVNGKVKYYKNETDNYKQNNFQLHFIHQFNSKLHFNVTGHYTKGAGYYEQYKQGQAFSKYTLQNVISPKGDTISSTDLIRRLWLDNDFAGGIFNLNYNANSKLAFTLGGGYNTYFGKHYGRIMWAQYASDAEIDHQYYLTTTNKNDANVYLKTNYKPTANLNVFVDLQLRTVAYRYYGYSDLVNQQYQNQSYKFFNPKLGLSYNLNSDFNIYTSFAIANKEPSGDDLSKNKPATRPTAEQLNDLEAGIKYMHKKIYVAANFYNMQYNNQLVLNGQIDNVGNPKHVNVANSYRRGIELELNYNLSKYFTVGGNLALSDNKIKNFVEYLDSSNADYSIYYDQHKTEYKNKPISFSPNAVSAFNLTIKPVKNLEIAFINKSVSRQYIDNTGRLDRSIRPYNVLNVRINYSIKTKLIPEISLMCSINNILNEKYVTNAYTYSSYADGILSTANYVGPAAPLNFLAGVSFKF